MVDKESAIKLRQEGYSYKTIATILGCSESWCKKELSNVHRGLPSTDDTKYKVITILEEALERIRNI